VKGTTTGLPGIKTSEAAKAADTLEEQGLSGAVISYGSVSMFTPDPEKQRRLARTCNDYFAKMRQEHKGVFGLFAGLPALTDVDGALAEITYSLDTLGAEGVQVMTSYGDQKWLGDPAFSPVWEELNRRRAIVHVHPNLVCQCADVPHISLELPFDSARGAFAMWQSGVFERYPEIRFIFCHGGGPIPMLIARYNSLGRKGSNGDLLHDADVQLKRYWYDTAQAASFSSLQGLMALADPKKILFGTDIPFGGSGNEQGAALKAAAKDDALVSAIEYDNVVALMPSMGSTARSASLGTS
jgi:predicted TIM-barrel fold metal-dependent hydrolase